MNFHWQKHHSRWSVHSSMHIPFQSGSYRSCASDARRIGQRTPLSFPSSNRAPFLRGCVTFPLNSRNLCVIVMSSSPLGCVRHISVSEFLTDISRWVKWALCLGSMYEWHPHIFHILSLRLFHTVVSWLFSLYGTCSLLMCELCLLCPSKKVGEPALTGQIKPDSRLSYIILLLNLMSVFCS